MIARNNHCIVVDVPIITPYNYVRRWWGCDNLDERDESDEFYEREG
jgi:hypothetical protein